jgi:hypothetical protein
LEAIIPFMARVTQRRRRRREVNGPNLAFLTRRIGIRTVTIERRSELKPLRIDFHDDTKVKSLPEWKPEEKTYTQQDA